MSPSAGKELVLSTGTQNIHPAQRLLRSEYQRSQPTQNNQPLNVIPPVRFASLDVTTGS